MSQRIHRSNRRTFRGHPMVFILFLLSFLLSLCGCNSREQTPSSEQPAGSAATVPSGALELVFTYGSEKEKWVNEVTQAFNRSHQTTKGGKPIFVKAIPMGSGECIDELLSGRRQAHLTSPASGAFIKLGNAQSRAKTGKDLIGSTDNLVLSPVVIAMWKPMAEAIGWGKKPIGWAEVLALVHNPKGWAAYGYPQWGRFKFGHTQPQSSNSGLVSVFAEIYAAAGKTSGLTPADVAKPHTTQFVTDIENSVVHYGSSTGFFGRKMYANGPQYLSAAVLYENMVIESSAQPNLAFPIVAIYPKEGTFWSDHPIGVVDREWVTPEHREAAKIYTDYLLARPQQEKAIGYGFRPASTEVPLAAPLDEAHGIDPQEPKTTLEMPSADVMDASLKLWQKAKKHSEVVLVLDTSGSMQEESKLVNAKQGARQFVSMLDDEDYFSLEPFSGQITWGFQDQSVKTGREAFTRTIDSLIADGGTKLYDAIDEAYNHLAAREDHSSRIKAVVILTDGADTESKTKLDELLAHIRFDGEKHSIRVFTIAYGRDAKQDVLSSIADATQAKFYAGTPQNILDVFKDISTFF